MKPADISEDELRRLCEEYYHTPHGEKQYFLNIWVPQFKIKPGSLRNRISEYQKKQGHKKSELDPPKVGAILNIVLFYRIMRIMPSFSQKNTSWKRTIQLTENHGWIPKGSVRVRELTRFIRKYNLIPEHRVTRSIQRHKSNSVTSHGGLNE